MLIMDYQLIFDSRDEALELLHAIAEAYRKKPAYPKVQINGNTLVVLHDPTGIHSNPTLSQLEDIARKEKVKYHLIN